MQTERNNARAVISGAGEPAGQAIQFLRSMQGVLSKVSRFETELADTAAGLDGLEKKPGAADFQHELWQLRGHHRFAARRVLGLRECVDRVLRSYSCEAERLQALHGIRDQVNQVESSVRELRLLWRDLSSTYHYMHGIVGILD